VQIPEPLVIPLALAMASGTRGRRIDCESLKQREILERSKIALAASQVLLANR